MIQKPARLHTVGQNYHDFKVTKSMEIPELQCWLQELVHIPTGAHVMHIANDDPENMFCLSFQTLPENSSGVAHILEHTVLCGSQKYPVKDPFFAMNRRSLNTFMNALTGSDFTCYPASTQVPQDFYNLLEVYLDAVFHPKIDELSFLQEGHRLEFSVPTDPSTPLEHKGVVFNEMKGSLASASSRLSEAMNAALFPNLTYGYNSGGDPADIPNLSYEDLCQFYRQYYTPSRCLFFFYGNMPLEKHLDFITEHALKNVKKVSAVPPLPPQPRFTKPHRMSMEYPLAAEEDEKDKSLISFGWLTCHILDQQDVIALSILEIILMDTDASPLKQVLLKSGYCKQAVIYMDVDISEIPVVITLKGCNPSKANDIEQLIRITMTEIAHNGIPLSLVENAMHQLEFYRSEITGNHAPFGLSLFMRSGLLRQHGGKPEDGLVIHSLFNEVHKRNLEDPNYLTNLLRKYFIDNPHFVRITMNPSKELAAKELADERASLDKLQKTLTDEQKQDIIKKARDLIALQKQQEEEEDFDVLPKITLDDVPKISRQYEITQEKIGPIEVYHHDCFTNGIVYADLIFDLPAFSEEELPLVRLYPVLVSQMGSGNRSYAETLEYIQANTGGASAYLALNLQASDHSKFTPSFFIRGKALHRKVEALFPLLFDLATSVDLTHKERLQEVILKHYTTMQGSLNNSGLKYAISLSASALDSAAKIANDWYGMEYYRFIKQLANDIETQIDPLIEKLQDIQNRLKTMPNPHVVITCDKAMFDTIKHHQFYGLQKIKPQPYKGWENNLKPNKVNSMGCIISSPVAFTGHVFKTISYVHPDAPVLSLAATLFDNLVLHPRIREQGGAYGSGAVSNALSGNFYFYAHRDPNINSTLEAFKDSIIEIVEGNFEDSDLEESKLEILQSLDSPIAPGSRGDLAYGWIREGKTPEIRQAYRDKLLATTREDIIAAVKKHIVNQFHTGATVVFAGKELLEKENEALVAQGKPPLPLEFV